MQKYIYLGILGQVLYILFILYFQHYASYMEASFRVGLDTIHKMTSQQNYSLRVELIHSLKKKSSFAEYDYFGVRS